MTVTHARRLSKAEFIARLPAGAPIPKRIPEWRAKLTAKRTAPRAVSGTGQLPLDALERALGSHAFELWRRFLVLRDDKTGACYAGLDHVAIRAARARGRREPVGAGGAAWKAMARLVEAGLVWVPPPTMRGTRNQDSDHPTFGWHLGVNPRDPEARMFVRQVFGLLEWQGPDLVAIVPQPVKRWALGRLASKDGRGGRRPGAGRPRKQVIKTGGDGPPKRIKTGALLSPLSVGESLGSPSGRSSNEASPRCEETQTQSETVPKELPEDWDWDWPPAARSVDEGARPAQTGCMPLGPSSDSLQDLLERGKPVPVRYPLPAWAVSPMERVGRPQASIPRPPLIPVDSNDHTAGVLLAEAFEATHKKVMGKAFWGFGGKPPSKSPHWDRIVALAHQLRATSTPPIAWMIWCARSWQRSGRTGMPPLAFVLGPKMQGESFEFFRDVEMRSMWGQPVAGPKQRKLRVAWAKLRNALFTGRYSSAEETYAKVITEKAFGELVVAVRAEMDAADALMAKQVEEGEWLWTL